MNLKFFKNMRQMVPYGERTQLQLGPNFLVGKAVGKQIQDFLFPSAQARLLRARKPFGSREIGLFFGAFDLKTYF
jgi:hypothetical protein